MVQRTGSSLRAQIEVEDVETAVEIVGLAELSPAVRLVIELATRRIQSISEPI